MEPVRVEVPGEPVALGRARASFRGGKPRMFTPAKSVSWKGHAAVFMRDAMAGQPPLQGAVKMTVEAVFSCPVSKHRKREPRASEPHTGPRDLDNIVKAVGDAGIGVLFMDDRQVAELHAKKRVGAQGEPPKVVIWVVSIP